MSKRPGLAQQQGAGCLIFFFGIFALAGAFALVAALRQGNLVNLMPGSIFLAIGVGGVAFGLHLQGKHAAEMRFLERGGSGIRPDWRSSTHFPPLKTRQGPRLDIALPQESGPVAAMIGLWMISIFWNGICWTVLIVTLTKESKAIALPVSIFIGIFCLIGLLMLYGAIHQTLRVLLVGETILEVSAEPVAPGEKLEWRLYQRGNFAIDEASVKILCEEKVQYRRGTDTITHKETIFEQVLGEGKNLQAGSSAPVLAGEIVLPADAPPSFKASNNNIVWSLKAKLALPGRPDVDETFLFRVSPEWKK